MVKELLSARDALTEKLQRVLSDQHPHPGSIATGTVFAVFGEQDGYYQGLVTEQQINRYPQRIFADLVPRPLVEPLAEDTSLESLQAKLVGECQAVAVNDAEGHFLGAVTSTSLLDALLRWHQVAQQKTRALLGENRRLMQDLFSSQEQERRYIARELHDELGQYCTAIQCELRTIMALSHEVDPRIQQHYRSIAEQCDQVQEIMHALLRRLRPELLDEMGLLCALEEMAAAWRRIHPDINCRIDTAGRLDGLGEPLDIAIYRIVQECLNNVAQHARASSVCIRLCRQAASRASPDSSEGDGRDRVLLAVADDGEGFVGDVSQSGLGLAGMRERVMACGGRLSIDSALQQGVVITVELPIEQTEQ